MVLPAAAQETNVFGPGKSLEFCHAVFRETISNVVTHSKAYMDTGNPSRDYPFTGPWDEASAKANTVSMEKILNRRIQSHLTGNFRTFDNAARDALVLLLTNPVLNPHHADVLGLEKGKVQVLWRKHFIAGVKGYPVFVEEALKDFFRNFFLWDRAIDRSIVLDKLGSVPPSFFNRLHKNKADQDRPEITKFKFGRLFMVLIAVVAEQWPGVGTSILVPQEDLALGGKHSRKCAERLLASVYESMSEAESYFDPHAKASDTGMDVEKVEYLKVNPALLAWLFLKIKAFGNGQSLVSFLRTYSGVSSRSTKISHADLDKLRTEGAYLENWFVENWEAFIEAYLQYFEDAGNAAFKKSPSNVMHVQGEDEDSSQDDRPEGTRSRSGSPIGDMFDLEPAEVAAGSHKCCYDDECIHKNAADMVRKPCKMPLCSSKGRSKETHKNCAFDFFKDMTVVQGLLESSGSLRDPDSLTKWGEELDNMENSVCRKCHEGKLEELKSAARTLKGLKGAPKRAACSTKYIGKNPGGGEDRRSGQVRHSSTRTHLYSFIYR